MQKPSDSGPILHLSLPGLLWDLPADMRVHLKGLVMPSLQLALRRAHSQAASYDLRSPDYSQHMAGDYDAEQHLLLQVAPCHLKADRDQLVLYDADSFDIDQHEADGLIALFNTHFGVDGHKLMSLSADLWLLRVDKTRFGKLPSEPVTKLVGKSYDAYLKQHGFDLKWHAFLNEVQMLFYTAPQNDVRERQGQFTINGIWANVLSPEAVISAVDVVYCQSKARAAAYAVPVHDALDAYSQLDSAYSSALVINNELASAVRYGDMGLWVDTLREIDTQWFEPAIAALRAGSLQALHVYCGNRHYILTKKRLAHFWKLQQSLTQLVCRAS